MRHGFLAGVVLLLPASGLRAQADVDMAEEVRFLRGLAKDWGFVDLAQDRLGELRRASATNEGTQRMLAQISAEVLFLGARRIRDLNKRKTVLAEALQKFDDYLSLYGRDAGASEVLASQAEACEYYGRFLSESIRVEKDPDKRKELEAEALDVFRKGIKASNDAMANLEAKKDETARAKVDYYLSWMRKGTLLREWGRTVPKDRKVKAEEAIETLESLALDIGEETAIGIKALLEMAVAQDVVGDTADAVDSYQGTIEIVVDRCKDDKNPIPLSTQALLFRFLEESYEHLTDIYVRDGQLDDCIKAVKTYQEQREELSLPSTPRFADAVLLNGAQAKFDTGGKDNVGKALQIAKDVATRHPSDFVGLRARDIIGRVLGSSGIAVSAEALAQAAQGEFQSKNYEAAVRAYKRVLRSLESTDEIREYGLRAYAQIGLAFALRERFLEAAFAFMEGLRKYGRMSADPTLPEKVVDYLNRAVRGLRRLGVDKKFVAEIKTRSDRIAVTFGTKKSIGKIYFVKAQNLIDDGRFDEALQSLRGVGKSVPRYELARTMLGFANWKKGDYAAARKALGAYLAWVKDPLNDIPADKVQRRQLREMAIADAHFYLGMMLADEAFGRNGRKPQPAKKKDVVQAFRNYAKLYGAVRPPYATRAAYELVKSLVDLERVPEGEAEYANLRKQFPNDPLLSNLAIVLFNARRANVDAIEQEIKALEADPAKGRALREAEGRKRQEIRKALSFATNYLGNERSPDYGLLRNASLLAAKLEDWGKAEFFLEKILAIYGDTSKYRLKIDSFVKPELAEIKMQKGDFRSALKLIEDAIKVQPNSYALKRLKVRALGGWCDFDKDGNFRRPQGLGEFEKAYHLLFVDKDGYGRWAKNKLEKFSFDWYRYQFDCLDMADKLSTKDANFVRAARSFFRIGQATDDFRTLENFGAKGRRLHLLFQQLKR